MLTKQKLEQLQQWNPNQGHWPVELTKVYNTDLLDVVDTIIDAELSSEAATYLYTLALNQPKVDERLIRLFAPRVRNSLYRNGYAYLMQPLVVDCLVYSFLSSYIGVQNAETQRGAETGAQPSRG